jgi:hypothetical protein
MQASEDAPLEWVPLLLWFYPVLLQISQNPESLPEGDSKNSEHMLPCQDAPLEWDLLLLVLLTGQLGDCWDLSACQIDLWMTLQDSAEMFSGQHDPLEWGLQHSVHSAVQLEGLWFPPISSIVVWMMKPDSAFWGSPSRVMSMAAWFFLAAVCRSPKSPIALEESTGFCPCVVISGLKATFWVGS